VSELERILATLPRSVDWPKPSEHMTTRVVARLEATKTHRPAWIRRWAWAVATLIVLVVALIPGARQAVANLFQEAGVRIGFVEELSSDLGGALELGEQVSIEVAESQVGFDLRFPAILETPEETYIDRAGLVSMLWEGPILLMQRDGGAAFAEKSIPSDSRVSLVELSGGTAVWVEGAEHSFSYLDTEGNTIRETTRLAGNVLLWSAEGVDYRLELSERLDTALEIAESLEETR
jgi:hypothetical protein